MNMSEHLVTPELKFTTYRDFVASTRFAEAQDAEWREDYASYVEGEHYEFLFQHGNGAFLLMPQEALTQMGLDLAEAPEDMRFKMADELGDSLWFTFDIAERAELDIQLSIETALRSHGVEPTTPIVSFADIESIAVEQAEKINVPNKTQLYGIEGIPLSSLATNPGYVLMRYSSRLSRALAKERFDAPIGPPGATSMEPVVGLQQAIGDVMLAYAYVARKRLDVPFEDVATFNIDKLRHRRIHGKANDIQYGETVK